MSLAVATREIPELYSLADDPSNDGQVFDWQGPVAVCSTQRLKSEYLYGGMDGETTERSAIMGALSLYLNFLNIFTLLLQLFGQRDE